MNDEEKRVDVRLQEPTYVLAPGYNPGWEETDEVRIGDYILVLWRRRMLILAGTILCTLAAFLISQMLPRVYEARATLIVQPPSFSTELKANPMSVETYQPIAESGYVLEATKNKLVEEGVLGQADKLGDTTTVIYPSKFLEVGYRPILELVVGSDDPQTAAAIANAWAETVIQESTGLVTEGKRGTLDFIRSEYPALKERLGLAEKELKETQNKFDRQINNKEDYWDSRVAEFKIEWNLEWVKQELLALQSQLTADVVRLNELDGQVKEAGDRLANLGEAIKGHSQFIVVSKAITDDALWDRIASDPEGSRNSQLEALKLRTEQPNPVYQRLQQQISFAQVFYSTLVPQREHLENKVTADRAKVQELNLLILQKENELQKLLREQERQLTQLRRDRNCQVVELKREVDSSQKTFGMLSNAYETARLAQAEADQDIKIGAYAVPSKGPTSPRPLLNTAIAFVVGLMLSTMLAFAVEFVQNSSAAR